MTYVSIGLLLSGDFSLPIVQKAPSRVRHGERQAFVTAVRLARDAANPRGRRAPGGGGRTGSLLPDPRSRHVAARVARPPPWDPHALGGRGPLLARRSRRELAGQLA